MCCKCCSVRQQKIWVFTLGIFFVVIGVLIICLWPGMIRRIIDNQLPLSPTSKTFKKWDVSPVPIYTGLILWNWTNPDKVRDLTVKPNFVPMGPYVFREHKIKEDMVWHPNSTVTYYGGRTWYFEPEMSNGTLEDVVTCPHLPTLATVNMLRDENIVKKQFMNRILNREGGMLTATKTADEWLFKGFFDKFLDFAMKLNNSNIPVDSPYFGLFLGRNGSKDFDGAFTIHTGQADLSLMGEINLWNGNDHTGYYEGECGKANGSTGDLWVPHRSEDETITMFIPDTCRFINMFPGEKVRKFGIDAIKYASNEMTFDSGENFPNMKCFCPPKSKECAKAGVIDISPCANGAPMYMSHTHFYLADPSYTENITGMAPDPEIHTYYIIMEPTLGVPLMVNADVMISFRIRRDNNFTLFRNIRDDFYAPFFTISNRANLSDELAKEVRLVLGLPSYGVYTGIAFTSLGAILIIVGTFLTLTRNWKGQKDLDYSNKS